MAWRTTQMARTILIRVEILLLLGDFCCTRQRIIMDEVLIFVTPRMFQKEPMIKHGIRLLSFSIERK